MKPHTTVKIFVDDVEDTSAEFHPPGRVILDTTGLADGEHRLKVVASDQEGAENIKIIPFTVRNGPYIMVDGLRNNDVVDGKVTMVVNAYKESTEAGWQPDVVEDPRGVPFWFWGVVMLIVAIALYYAFAFSNPNKAYLNKTVKDQVKMENVTKDNRGNKR